MVNRKFIRNHRMCLHCSKWILRIEHRYGKFGLSTFLTQSTEWMRSAFISLATKQPEYPETPRTTTTQQNIDRLKEFYLRFICFLIFFFKNKLLCMKCLWCVWNDQRLCVYELLWIEVVWVNSKHTLNEHERDTYELKWKNVKSTTKWEREQSGFRHSMRWGK